MTNEQRQEKGLTLHFLCSDQVQEELRRVVGSSQVRVEDRKNLPFTDAVIHEIQRLANIVPMAIPHKTARDVTLNGYFIKEVEFPHLFQEEKVNNVFFSAFTDIQCENYNSANPYCQVAVC